MKTISSQLATLVAGGGKMRKRIAPFARYIALLVSFILLYAWIFHVIMAWEGQDHSWFTGIYWALTVMSTLGFGDITFHSDLGYAFSSVVLLTGVVMLLIILPFLFIQLVYAPWLEERARNRAERLRRVPDDVSGHVLICNDDPIAVGLVRRLELVDISAYIIEPDADVAMTMHDSGLPVVAGDVDSVETFRRAGAERARLVVANASDTVNSNIVLTVREISETVPVVALADVVDSVDVLELSGANHVLQLPAQLGEHLANRVRWGSAHANRIGRALNLTLAEFPVHDTPLQNRSLREVGLTDFTGVSVAAVWRGGTLHPVDPDEPLSPLCVPLVVGSEDQLRELDEVLAIYDANPNPVLIIGGGKVGRAAGRALKERGIPVHIVERNADLEPKIVGIPDKLFIGDAADRAVLDRAGIADTPSVLLTTHDDAMNVYLTVYCRRLNPDARILTRVTHKRNVHAIQRAGADFVLSYASFGVQTIFAIVRGREATVLGEEMSLFYISVPPALRRKRLGDADITAKTGLIVIAADRGGTVVSGPGADYRLDEGVELVTLGSVAQRERFDQLFETV
ncbi:MAG: potassium transporter TrkA [Gemmatimonadetes bacterium]|nr:potassium transporter TrkA [Gemmatimonadota bacterium]